MITKKDLEDAPMWTVIRGEAEDPGPIGWDLFELDVYPDDVMEKMKELDVSCLHPERDEDSHQSRKDADDLDAALMYLRRGGTLCKVPDELDSQWSRMLVVGPVIREEVDEESESVQYVFHLSDRGIPLVWITQPMDGEIILTMENYLKWYGLHLLHADGHVEQIPFPDEEWAKPGETAYGDHVPNPHVVQRFADKKGYLMDDQAFEMIIGRWELEYVDAAATKYGGDSDEEDDPPS